MSDNDTSVNDVSTIKGFLAQFDTEVSKLASQFGWCGEGRRRAYREISINPDRPYAGLPMHAVDDSMLSDAGRAARDAEDAAKVAELREQALRLCERGLADSYGNRETFTAALNALGLQGSWVTTVAFNQYGSLRGFADKRLEGDARARVEAKITEAATAAYAAEDITFSAEPSFVIDDYQNASNSSEWVTGD